MSKLDAQRAMREARYAAQRATPRKAPSAATPAPVAPARTLKPQQAAPEEAAEPAEQSCGHRSMNGRTCTRPAGHAEKNHRYG